MPSLRRWVADPEALTLIKNVAPACPSGGDFVANSLMI
jgi:hypothetical protein